MANPVRLWHGLREWPWDEAQVPRPRTPHPEPTMRATVGNWLEELGITTFPPAPPGWKLVQRLAEGWGMDSRTGRPLKKRVRSLSLAYLHLGTARGATAILHHAPAARKTGEDSWLFAEGGIWSYCTEIDCDHDRTHLTADGWREAGATEIKKLLTEGTT